MVPGMDLQTQYDKTLQNTIGQSQRQRNEALRQSQDGVTDWEKRGASGFRGAGFNEVNPSTMPAMDDTTRGYLAPILGTYQEGGQNREGYYGDLNPYTVEGALKYASKAGFTDADTTLQQQAKNAGLSLPSLFGHTLANEAARTWGSSSKNNLDSNYSSFVPGQDVQLGNGDYWRWKAGAPQYTSLLMNNERIDPEKEQNYLDSLNNYNMGLLAEKPVARQLTQDEQIANDVFDYYSAKYPEGSGIWFYNKGGKEFGDQGLEYSPTTGYSMQTYDSPAKGFNKFMPALTMAALGAMTGGAGYASMGGAAGGTGALAGQAVGAAIPSTMQTGLTTGDWGNALKTGLISGAGSFLGGAYGKGLGEAMNLSGKTAALVGKGLIGAGTNLAGNALMGRNMDWAGALGSAVGNIGGSYLGDLASNAIGGTLGEAAGGGVGALSKGLSSSLFAGKGLDLRDIATRTALGAVTPTLSSLFSGDNQIPEERNQPTKLASTLANAMHKNNKRL